MLSDSFRRRHFRREGGVALVLVLSFVVLLTAVVLLYLSRAMTARQLSSGSLQQSNADQLAVSALDIITGSLKQEIANPANSVATTYGAGATQTTVYEPRAAANILPARYTGPNGAPTNLVRISSSTDTTLQYPSGASAVNSTTAVSLNQRAVSLARWNSHYLLPLKSTANANTDSTPDSTFTAPDWVLVTDTGGPTVLTTPSSSVIGRYAYAIYDEGGLLDVNVAGYPSKATTSQYGDKPAMAYADLTQLTLPATPTVSILSTADIDNLVGWRNYASLQLTAANGVFGSFTIPATATTQLQNFFNVITGNTSGFMNVSPVTWTTAGQTFTDQAFLTRQQLLKYRASTGFNANALQYLGTFSRDLNAPSWKPVNPPAQTLTPPANMLPPALPTPTDYVSSKDSTTAVNRDALGVRVKGTFTRADGTTAQVGDPLLKYRFPLSRLAEITYDGSIPAGNTTLLNGILSPATAATIQRDFGLVWVPGDGSGNPADIGSAPHWSYCGPNGTTIQSSIETLAQVGNSPAVNPLDTTPREPNFFELLKAAILNGSLGRDAGKKGSFLVNRQEGPASDTQYADSNVDFQVIQIGANIINQAATDGYPREIHFVGQNYTGGGTNQETAFFGIANLPYLQRVFTRNTYTGQDLEAWYMAEIWNPHQTLANNNVTSCPTQFRFCGIGGTMMFYQPKIIQWSPLPSPNGTFSLVSDSNGADIVTAPVAPAVTPLDLANSGYLQFTVPWNSTTCREPTYLATDPTVMANPANSLTPTVVPGTNGRDDANGDTKIVGLYSGKITTPTQTAALTGAHPHAPMPLSAGSVEGGADPQGCSLVLEYYNQADGTWRVYDEMRYLWGIYPYTTPTPFYLQHSDPRTDHFGTSIGNWNISTQVGAPGSSIRTGAAQGLFGYTYFPRPNNPSVAPVAPFTPSEFIFNVAIANDEGTGFYMGTLSDNTTGSNPYYVDPDGVLRGGDGYWVANSGVNLTCVDGRPLATTNTNSRPIILNRPFRNVGELGYAFADRPWKNIDFFTPYSADSGLLDFFCARESSTNTPVVAGTVNLNTRQAPVLQAIIAGATKNEVAAAPAAITGLPTVSSDASKIATAIVSQTSSSAFMNRGDLVLKGSPLFAVSTDNTADQYVKTRREAAVRALSEVDTTRIWNLMIDVVAQVGHYPSTSTSLSQFVVDGEKRYWLHIAIDRYTGQVIDRVLEPVYE